MIRLIFGTLATMIVIIGLMFGQLFTKTNNGKNNVEDNVPPEYHVQVFIQDTNEYFWELFQEGVEDASQEYLIYPEFITLTKGDIKELENVVEMGVNAGVDGIALSAVDSTNTQKLIEYSENEGVRVVTYENDNYLMPNTSAVGTNSYSAGYMAGEMAIEASDRRAKAVLIIPDSSDDRDLQYKNMIVQGVLESFSKYSTIDLEHIMSIKSHLFEAEKVASTIINEYSDIDMIICMDERSTPGVAQSLVDNNLVGDIKLIGYGLMPQTIDYIEKGVIHGTIYPNAHQIGYEVISQLYKSLEGEQISDYINTDLYSIDAKNIKDAAHIIKSD